MQKYQLEVQAEEGEGYKQDLGLRKMLYKYEHQNDQLRNQIKALSERLTIILDKSPPQTLKQKPTNTMQDLNERYLNDQMNILFKQIQEANMQIKKHKELINQNKEDQYIILQNKLKNKDSQLSKLRTKIRQYQHQEERFKISSINKIKQTKEEQLYQESINLSNELQILKKRVRNLEKQRNQKQRKDITTHQKVVDMGSKNRKIRESASPPPHQQQEKIVKKKGLWHKQLTEENYYQLKEELQQLKKQKNVMIQSIKIENKGLNQHLHHLREQYNSLFTQNNSFEMPTLPKKEKVYLDTSQKRNSNTPIMVNKSLNLGPSQYERKNDKNFVAKKQKNVQWLSTVSKKGLTWRDDNCKSPLTGINLWFDKFLIGIQFVHTMGQSIQHMHLINKKIVPIQYRLSGNDYVENIVLVINEGMITGIQIVSKNSRKDNFGQKVGTNGTKKFDFGIKSPEKPIFSYGSFIINKDNVSVINKLGFSII